jgi:hypothetical protein
MSHLGVRCGFPSRQILAADGERTLQVITARGPRPIRGSNLVITFLEPSDVSALSPILRSFLPLPHVVGLGSIKGELIWLVDGKRIHPDVVSGFGTPSSV